MSRPPRPTLDQLLDVFVYAPAGVLLGVAAEFPDAIRRGKDKLEPQINVARAVGPSLVRAAQTSVQEGFRSIMCNVDTTKTRSTHDNQAAAADPGAEHADTDAPHTDDPDTNEPDTNDPDTDAQR